MTRIQNREQLLAEALHEHARELRGRLLDLCDAALEAVDPARCTQRALGALRDQGVRFERVTLFAFGKAARGMAEAALREVDVTGGMMVAPTDSALAPLKVVAGGHPVPLPDAPDHGRAMLQLARSLGPDDLALVLVSGGGSAMLELPAEGISLSDIVTVTRALLASGAAIEEVNAVRAALSQLKGGKLAQAMPHTPVVNVLLSDVVGAPASTVASGPTLAPDPAAPDARDVIARYGLAAQLPENVLGMLAQPTLTLRAAHSVTTHVAGDNGSAQTAMVELARSRGWPVTRRQATLVGEARDMAGVLLTEAAQAGTLYIAGGETTVTLRAQGKGGRNHELALAALAQAPEATLATLGTDGVDGSSGAAGAIADVSSAAHARRLGLDLAEHLAQHNSGPLFAASGGAIVTGPTGTNVADVVAVFPPSPRGN